LELPGFYIGAGGVTHTVWNHLLGLDPLHGLKDLDLVYFDRREERLDDQKRTDARVRTALEDIPLEIDVTNEAWVHLWYPRKFGRVIAPYRSTEHAIGTWPTTASSIGVRLEKDRLKVCAPFGLGDLLSLTVRPNKSLVSREVYESKVARWISLWPDLTVIAW
jgi:hypothetical protein